MIRYRGTRTVQLVYRFLFFLLLNPKLIILNGKKNFKRAPR